MLNLSLHLFPCVTVIMNYVILRFIWESVNVFYFRCFSQAIVKCGRRKICDGYFVECWYGIGLVLGLVPHHHSAKYPSQIFRIPHYTPGRFCHEEFRVCRVYCKLFISSIVIYCMMSIYNWCWLFCAGRCSERNYEWNRVRFCRQCEKW